MMLLDYLNIQKKVLNWYMQMVTKDVAILYWQVLW